MTRLDILGGINKLEICHSYQLGPENIDYFPGSLKVLGNCQPLYDTLPGWEKLPKDEWREIANTGYDALPENMKGYLKYIEEKCKTPVNIISIGPGREDTIMQ